MPTINIIADESQDDAFLTWHFKMCAKAEIAVSAGFVDAANALVPHEREFENLFVESCGGLQVAGVEEGDCLVKGHGF